MSTPLSDNLVAPLLHALRACLCTELERTPSGRVCRCSLVHNALVPTMDGCDCECAEGQGDAWVRLIRLEPDDALNPTRSGSCPPGWIAVVEIGSYRCIPVPEEGEPYTEQQLTDIANAQLADMNAHLRVLCCPDLRDRDYGVDFWQPIGPSGGCAGGALQIRVALPGGPGGC